MKRQHGYLGLFASLCVFIPGLGYGEEEVSTELRKKWKCFLEKRDTILLLR